MTKISRRNLLGSCEEKLTFNKLFIAKAKGFTKTQTLKGKSKVISSQQSREPKTTIGITWRQFFISSLCSFTFSFARGDTYHAITIWELETSPFSYICWFPYKNAVTKLFDEVDILSEKYLVSQITKKKKKIIRIHFLIIIVITLLMRLQGFSIATNWGHLRWLFTRWNKIKNYLQKEWLLKIYLYL